MPLPSCHHCGGVGKVCVSCGRGKDHNAGMRNCNCLMSIPEPLYIRKLCDSTEFYVMMVMKTYLTYDEWHEAVSSPTRNL